VPRAAYPDILHDCDTFDLDVEELFNHYVVSLFMHIVYIKFYINLNSYLVVVSIVFISLPGETTDFNFLFFFFFGFWVCEGLLSLPMGSFLDTTDFLFDFIFGSFGSVMLSVLGFAIFLIFLTFGFLALSTASVFSWLA
jgi:hypothetical protein